jgi:ketosteroid isomerase-like protein
MRTKIFSFFLLVVFLTLTAIASDASEAPVSDRNTTDVYNISPENQAIRENLTEQENIMEVRQAYVDFSKRNVPSVLNKFAENAEWVQPGGPEVPLSGVYHGMVQIAGFFLGLNANLEFTQFDINKYIARGNEVVVVGSYQARIKSTGKIYSSDFVSIFTIESGKIVRYETYHDTAAIVLANTATL